VCTQDADFQEDETIYDALRLEELDQVRSAPPPAAGCRGSGDARRFAALQTAKEGETRANRVLIDTRREVRSPTLFLIDTR
jgi:CCR4-NOT transcriptional regulation complex NOT5 subunit